MAIKNPAADLNALLAAKLGDVYDPEKGTLAAPVLVDAAIRDEADPAKRNSSAAYSNPTVNPFQTWSIHYNRLHLEDTLGQIADPIIIPGIVQTIHQALTVISAAAGVTITADDVEDGPISGEAVEVTLTAKATSKYFIGAGTAEALVEAP